MRYRMNITLLCEGSDYEGHICDYIAEYLAVLTGPGSNTGTKILCGYHAHGTYGHLIWSPEATLFPLSGDSPQPPRS